MGPSRARGPSQTIGAFGLRPNRRALCMRAGTSGQPTPRIVGGAVAWKGCAALPSVVAHTHPAPSPLTATHPPPHTTQPPLTPQPPATAARHPLPCRPCGPRAHTHARSRSSARALSCVCARVRAHTHMPPPTPPPPTHTRSRCGTGSVRRHRDCYRHAGRHRHVGHVRGAAHGWRQTSPCGAAHCARRIATTLPL